MKPLAGKMSVSGKCQRPKAVDNMMFTSFRYYLPHPGDLAPRPPCGPRRASSSASCPLLFLTETTYLPRPIYKPLNPSILSDAVIHLHKSKNSEGFVTML
jgi:hypothetical protein